MSWPARFICGTRYKFDHLQPFTLQHDGHRIAVRVGAHSFTREVRAGDPPDLLFRDGNSARTFCTTRYGHLLHLRAAVIGSVSGSVFANHSKCIFKAHLPGVTGPYIIAFELRKSTSPKYDAKMQIVSAHHRSTASRMKRCTFSDALNAVVSAQPIPWTKK